MFRALAAALAFAAAAPGAATDTLTNVYPFCGQFKSDQFNLYGAGYRAHVCVFKTFPLGAVVETDIGKYPTLRDQLAVDSSTMTALTNRCLNHPDASKQGRAVISALFAPVTTKNAAGETVVKWYKVVPCHRPVLTKLELTFSRTPARVGIESERDSLGSGGRFAAKGAYDNGKTYDLGAGQAAWTSSPAGLVSVDADGKVTGLAAGTAQVTATAGSISATVPVEVVSLEICSSAATSPSGVWNDLGKTVCEREACGGILSEDRVRCLGPKGCYGPAGGGYTGNKLHLCMRYGCTPIDPVTGLMSNATVLQFTNCR